MVDIAQLVDPVTIFEWTVKVGPWALFVYAEMRRREEREERIKGQESMAAYLKQDIIVKDGIAKELRSVVRAFLKGTLSAEERDRE